MSQVGPRKYDLPYTNGEIEIAAYESDTEKQIFVYRHRMKNVIEPAIDYEVKLELQEGASEVTLYRIDEDYCNPEKIWKQMGSPVDLTPSQIEEIKEKSKLIPESLSPEIVDGKLYLKSNIGVNDVHCYIVKTR